MCGRRVPVADDLAPVLSAVEALLRESFEIVGMASDGQTALESTMLYQVHLHHWLECNDYGRFLIDDDL
jgi:hypothetical protein